MKKKILAVLTGLLLVLGITLATATPAAASYSQCPAGTGCVFIDSGGNGAYAVLAFSIFQHDLCWNFSGINTALVNSISSAKADYGSGWGIRLYMARDCNTSNGATFSLHHKSTSDMNNWLYCDKFGGNCNDDAESFAIEQI